MTATEKKLSWQKTLERTNFYQRMDFLDRMFTEKVRVSIDIGAYSVKVAQIKDTSSGSIILAAGYKEIPFVTEFKEGAESYDDTVARTLKDLLKEVKIRTKRVRVVISDPAIYIRHIHVPNIPEDELEKAIKWQAEKFVSFPIEHSIVDFQTIESDSFLKENQRGVILVALERAIADKYLSIVQAAGLTPVLLTAAPFAIASAGVRIYGDAPKEVVVLVDIGFQSSSIVMIQGQYVKLIRCFDLAGKHLTAAIANGLNLTLPEAEKTKKEFSLKEKEGSEHEKYAKFFQAVEPKLKELIDQINRSFAYCEREFSIERVHRVILCGGGADLQGLGEYLTSQLSLPVARAGLLENSVSQAKKKEAAAVNVLAPQFLAAIGGCF